MPADPVAALSYRQEYYKGKAEDRAAIITVGQEKVDVPFGAFSKGALMTNAVAACMKSEGFDYVPVDAAAAQTALTGRPNLSGEEFERQFGHA